jgi:hypothetical protein
VDDNPDFTSMKRRVDASNTAFRGTIRKIQKGLAVHGLINALDA